MKREEAIERFNGIINAMSISIAQSKFYPSKAELDELCDMAIEALQTDIVKCENCKYQDECEEVVLFEVTDDEVIGHRVHWCSYGRSE